MKAPNKTRRRTAAGAPHPRQLRELVIILAHELFPDADNAGISIDNGLGTEKDNWSGIRVMRLPRRHRWPARPRAFQTRRRMGKPVAAIFGGSVRAAVCFYRGGVTVGAVMIPLPGRPAADFRSVPAAAGPEGGAA